MHMEFKVTYDDGTTLDVVAKPKDIVAFERTYDLGIAELGQKPRMEHLYFLAWSPLHRQGRERRAFDEFMDLVASIEPQEDSAPAVPFDPAPSGESSDSSAPQPD